MLFHAALLEVVLSLGLTTPTGFLYSQLSCLSEAVYFEARSEPIAGQFAVENVIINRTLDPKYPDSICEVVHQKHQFSYRKKVKTHTVDLSNHKVREMLERVVVNSYLALAYGLNDNTKGSIMFLNPKIAKYRFKKHKTIAVAHIGNHLFYAPN